MKKLKYIVLNVDGTEHIFVFPEVIVHKEYLEECIWGVRIGWPHWERPFAGSRIVAAGFVIDGVCHGGSETLGVSSRGLEDTILLHGEDSIIVENIRKRLAEKK